MSKIKFSVPLYSLCSSSDACSPVESNNTKQSPVVQTDHSVKALKGFQTRGFPLLRPAKVTNMNRTLSSLAESFSLLQWRSSAKQTVITLLRVAGSVPFGAGSRSSHRPGRLSAVVNWRAVEGPSARSLEREQTGNASQTARRRTESRAGHTLASRPTPSPNGPKRKQHRNSLCQHWNTV